MYLHLIMIASEENELLLAKQNETFARLCLTIQANDEIALNVSLVFINRNKNTFLCIFKDES